jgi:hypothetical protein
MAPTGLFDEYQAMRYDSPRLIAVVLAMFFIAACALMTADSLAPAAGDGQAEELQKLVGGLGCGPAVDLSRCAFSFDPRLCPDCPLNQAPVPGAIYFCSQHGCSILYCRPLVMTGRLRRAVLPDGAEEDGDGRDR